MADSTLNSFLATGTTTQRLAFTPSPPTPASGPTPEYVWWDTTLQALYAWNAGTAAWVAAGGGGSGTVTHTAGALTAGQLIVGNGAADIKVGDLSGDVSTSGSGVTTIGALKVATGMIQASAVTYAKMQNVSASSKLLGSSATGIGAAPSELTLGTNLSMSGSTLNAAGGTGNVTSTTAVGSEPGTPASGDLDLYNNSFSVVRYSGSAWVPWGPLFPLTDPSLASISTWVNQGGASVSTTNGGILLSAPAAAGDNIRLRVKTAPATPYKITAMLKGFGAVNAANVGLAFRESGSGKIALAMLGGAFTGKLTSAPALASITFTNPTTFNAVYVSNNFPEFPLQMPPAFLRIEDDGTNRIISISSDGINFMAYHTVIRTDFLTADQVGFFVNSVSSTAAAGALLMSWKES